MAKAGRAHSTYAGPAKTNSRMRTSRPFITSELFSLSAAASYLQYMLNPGREIPARRAAGAGARRPGALTLANCVRIGEKTHRSIQHCFSRRSWKDHL